MATQPKNSPKDPIHLNYFQGGSQVSEKLGIANSFYSSQALDFRSDPSKMTVLPGMSDVSNGVLTGVIEAMEQDLSGTRWAVAHDGSVYRINSSNVVSKEFQLTTVGTAGLYYDQITDQLYIPGTQTVSMYGQVTTGISGNPKYRPDNFAQSDSNDPGCTNLYNPDDGFFDGVARVVATGSYTVPTALSETANNTCNFAPDIEPFYSIKVFIVSKGTGNWTLTLHDSLNNTLATVTVTNANLTNNDYNEFKFSGPVRAIVQQTQTGNSATYHWHITSTVGDGTVSVVTPDQGTGGTGDLASAKFLLYAYRLVSPANGWHPTAYFNGQLCIGNERYLSTYDFTDDSTPTNQQWIRHRLIFKAGYQVCGLSTNNQYLVIALERRSTDASRSYQDGQLVFWDGSSSNPSFLIDIPMGAPYGLQTFNNVTYFVCAGSLFAWSGGQTVIKVRKLAYQNTNYLGTTDTTIVKPNMMAIRYNLLMIGYPSTTTNVSLNYGIYTWGSVEVMYPNSLGYDYVLSNGLQNVTGSNGLQIGCVYNFVDTMYTSWQYTDNGGVTHYGLDVLNNSSAPAPNWNWRSLIFDGGAVYKVKEANRLQITFLPLAAGSTLTPFYNINRSGDVQGPTASVGSSKIVIDIGNGNARYHEFQYGFTGTSGATPVTITGVTFETDPLPEEVTLHAQLND